ncbi:hypothetical protein CIHG_02874 [Coccidioides immitis H538.4]|uniref:Uncharacterized protein n=1 Tax=Coccidioides immitis H538.4 TaxID=396776 RepID=A0A0J8RJS8_COCIT|nr:hypothetical protein CIHG_02874 [Coccidioides immitis H538.4]
MAKSRCTTPGRAKNGLGYLSAMDLQQDDIHHAISLARVDAGGTTRNSTAFCPIQSQHASVCSEFSIRMITRAARWLHAIVGNRRRLLVKTCAPSAGVNHGPLTTEGSDQRTYRTWDGTVFNYLSLSRRDPRRPGARLYPSTARRMRRERAHYGSPQRPPNHRSPTQQRNSPACNPREVAAAQLVWHRAIPRSRLPPRSASHRPTGSLRLPRTQPFENGSLS